MLKVKIVDDSQPGLDIDMVSTGVKVNADYKFVNLIEELGLAYKLN
jgi:hypothetical protein